jgi:hypothetical protein
MSKWNKLLVIWKGKWDWQTPSQINKRKKEMNWVSKNSDKNREYQTNAYKISEDN